MSRRHRLVISTSLALIFLAGCPAPSMPPGTGKKPGATGGRGQAVEVAGSVPDTEAPPGEQPAGSSSSASGNAGAGAAGSTAVAGAAPLDPQKFLLGRVFAPSGILSNNGGSVIGGNTASVIGQNTANIVSNNGGSVIGGNTASIVSNNGGSVIGGNTAGVIGQNTANVIGQNTANIVSNNGGSVIGGNTASIVSNNGGSLGQRPLAYAKLRVVDAAGKPKNGKNGQPLVGQADAWGQFYVPREEIDANSVIEVESPEIKGQLKAFVAKGAQTPEKELEVDMVSTLATTYILEEFVKGDQAVFERLTPEIEAEARRDVTEALTGSIDEVVKTTDADTLVATVDDLIGRDTSVEDVFKRIERLLILVGIQDDGSGMRALDVPLEQIEGLVRSPDDLYVFTATDHRLRRIDANGFMWNVVPENGWPYPENRPKARGQLVSGMAWKDGTLYLADTYNHRVVQIRDGKVDVLAGTGTPGRAEEGVRANDSPINQPTGLAVANDGTIYFSDCGTSTIKRITTNGTLETVIGGGVTPHADQPRHPREIVLDSPNGLAFDKEGRLVISDTRTSLVRQYTVATNRIVDITSRYEVVAPLAICVVGDNLYVSTGGSDGLYQLSNNKFVNVAREISAANFNGKPWLSSARAIAGQAGKLVIQKSDGLLVEIDIKTGADIHPVAGRIESSATATLVKATKLAINERGDIAIADENGRRVHLKREGYNLDTIAGNGTTGFVRSTLDARAIPIGEAVDVAWGPEDELYIVSRDDRPNVKRLVVNGRIETIIGNGVEGGSITSGGIATDLELVRPSEVFVFLDGRVGIVDYSKVWVLNLNGRLEEFLDWPEIKSPRKITVYNDHYLMFDNTERSVIRVNSGVVERVVSGREIEGLIGNEDVRAVASRVNGDVVFATKFHVFAWIQKTGSILKLGGDGGRVLNGASRDDSIQDLRDLAFAPSGDLVILENDQLKVIPEATLSEHLGE